MKRCRRMGWSLTALLLATTGCDAPDLVRDGLTTGISEAITALVVDLLAPDAE